MNKAKIVGTGFSFLVMILAGFEGTRLSAYQDIVGVWTICSGHTEGVRPSDTATREQCHAMLDADALVYWDGIDRMITVPLRPREQIAFTSLAYHVGLAAVARSSIPKKANAGNMAGACLAILSFNKGGGRAIPAFDRRRKIEHDICIGATAE